MKVLVTKWLKAEKTAQWRARRKKNDEVNQPEVTAELAENRPVAQVTDSPLKKKGKYSETANETVQLIHISSE